jgi:hypothetical protein
MPQRQFAQQKKLIHYAERNALAYAWEDSHAFAKRQRVPSPEQYEIVEVRTSRGMNRAMLFSQAILLAEWEANAPLRQAMTINRERWRVKRAQERRAAAARAAKQRSLRWPLGRYSVVQHDRSRRNHSCNSGLFQWCFNWFSLLDRPRLAA